ncbi:aminodeoxychorismate synthase, subunit I [Desulfurobacterium atlanticum]|uniref:Anthranilate synthase component 1 n=1 Tax=Desulfurobacterium atlanticum TaxID=240169 RepID=A0A238Y6X6_9BACT|nr:aminodeoxychorismate synthase, subunit I [Desulfurobacterium atlanticum]
MVRNVDWIEPYELFKYLVSKGFPVKLFLDSATVNGKTGRFSFICVGEKEKLLLKTGDFDGFEKLKKFYDSLKKKYPEDFGIFGYLSYDAVRDIEKLPDIATDDIGMPDILFFLPETTFVFDNLKKEIKIYGDEVEISGSGFSFKQFPPFNIKFKGFNMSKDYFVYAVEKIKEYIASGDTFQVNFSQRLDFEIEGSSLSFYDSLRKINPSPFSFYFDIDGFEAVSCSPERLIKKEKNVIETRPIAGTRRRGKNKEEDLHLSRELLLSEKERAEHIMLVDLERNDIGKVARYGTVEVDELMVLESYSHVIHIVSNVKGEVDSNVHPVDIVKAMFPGGTITGAPKVRTMEIIEELEPTRRALYTGSVGYFSFEGNLDFNIVIRTLLIKENRAYLQVGAGIVWDSVPDLEYKETINKGKAFLTVAGIDIL